MNMLHVRDCWSSENNLESDKTVKAEETKVDCLYRAAVLGVGLPDYQPFLP